jgi:glycine/D-amino acid oxidase-like deaminating enzyme
MAIHRQNDFKSFCLWIMVSRKLLEFFFNFLSSIAHSFMSNQANHPPKQASYWTDAFAIVTSSQGPPIELPTQTELAVIGGGFTGLSTALHAAKKGAQVVLLEQETVGWGASTRNAGMALTGLKLSPEKLVKKFGHQKARRFFEVSLEAIADLEQLLIAENFDCDFLRCGELCVAYRPSHFQGLIAAQKLLQGNFQHETQLLSPAELQKELGSKNYHGGLLDVKSAGLHPAKLVAGLAASARRAGVFIFERTPVLACRRNAAGFLLETSRGTIRTRELVAATNAYTPFFLSNLRRRIIPVGSYIIVTEKLNKDLAAELLPTNRMVYDTKNFLFYFRRTPDDRLLFGGRTSFTPMTDHQAAGILQRDMLQVFPQLGGVKIEHAWHGNVGFAFDQMPHLGAHQGVHYAMGYAGHGVVMSICFGKCLAQILGGGRCDSPFLDLSFPSRIFYRRRPWFLPVAGAYYKFRDRYF